MKSKIIFLIVFVLFLAGVVFLGYWKATPAIGDKTNLPRIEVAPLSYDFGEVDFGKVVDYTFRIRNTGEEVLEIKRVATSCGCTTAKASKTEINPGEETDLLVSYDTAAMGSGAHATGNQERIIYIKTNDPVTPQTQVTISAYVK